DELCTRNVMGAPFRLPSDAVPAEKTRAHAVHRLRCLEEEIRSLRVQCAEVLLVNERMRVMQAADFFFDMFEHFRKGENPKIESEFFKKVEIKVQILNKEGNYIVEELFLRIKEKYLFCSFCNRFVFNARQSFLHIGSHDHVTKIKGISSDFERANNLLIEMVRPEVIRSTIH
ncbi:hypothetical protein PMAYCL1PPCAC_01275, partial [Pristionchus mayeri]